MRTTLVIPDAVYRALKRRAAETGKTVSGLVTEFIRRGLAERPEPADLPALPRAKLGAPRVDVSDRAALVRLLDAERDRRLSAFDDGGGFEGDEETRDVGGERGG